MAIKCLQVEIFKWGERERERDSIEACLGGNEVWMK